MRKDKKKDGKKEAEWRRKLAVVCLAAGLFALLPGMSVTLSGCASKEGDVRQEDSKADAITFTDDLGREVTVDACPERVASLLQTSGIWQEERSWRLPTMRGRILGCLCQRRQ